MTTIDTLKRVALIAAMFPVGMPGIVGRRRPSPRGPDDADWWQEDPGAAQACQDRIDAAEAKRERRQRRNLANNAKRGES